jgi:hypothetical protein
MHHGSIVDPFGDFGQEHVMSDVIERPNILIPLSTPHRQTT